MNRRSNSNLGDEIKNIVQNALNNKDFNRLNKDIENIVKGALDEVRKSIDWKQDKSKSWSNQNYNGQTKDNYSYTIRKEKKYNGSIMNSNNNVQWQGNRNSKSALKPTKFTVPMGQVSNILFTVFGSIGSIIFGVPVLGLILTFMFNGERGLLNGAIGIFPLFALSAILFMNGRKIRKRLKRFQRYIIQLRGRNYCLINEFSSATGLSNKAVVKDLRKMITIGMFPEGHIDDKNTCFMLNNECYEQYLQLQKHIEIKNFEDQEKQLYKTTDESLKQEESNTKDELKPEIRKAIDEGRKFVAEIKDANIAIPGEEISQKLDRLENITGRIYDYVEIHPEKFSEIKKFTEYFLPTTLKLVDAYRKLDYQPIEGENISSAKKEIEDTMDTINLAFENLLDSLFEDVAMDISTDISVLQTMFAQEGLTEKNMKVKK